MESYFDNKVIKFLFKDKIMYFKFQKTIKVTFCLSLYCFLLGLILWIIFNRTISYELRYDDQCIRDKECNFKIKLNKKIEGPAYIYIKMENFFLNHRLIADSFSSKQLQGNKITEEEAKKSCGKYIYNEIGEKLKSINNVSLDPKGIMYPCGLKPFLYFKDIYNLSKDNIKIDIQTTDLISKNYKKNKFKNLSEKNNLQWIDFQDEFFLQWMKTPTYKNFEKLYGKLENGLEAGEYNLTINSNSKDILKSIKKYFVIKNLTFLGGRNMNLVYAHMATSGILFMAGLVLIIFENNSKL